LFNALKLTLRTISVSRIADLRRRFEVPCEKNRWDSPLFRVNMTPAETTEKAPNGAEAVASTTATTSTPDKECPPAVDVEAGGAPGGDANTAATKTVFSSWRPKAKSRPTGPGIGSADAASVRTVGTSSTSTTTAQTQNGKLWFSGVLRDEDALLGDTAEHVVGLIHQHLMSIPTAAPNSSTISVPRVEADLLYELDRVSQRIVQSIIAHQTESLEGTPLVFHEFDRSLALHRHVGLAELQRHRRQFVKANTHTPPSDANVVGSSFIDFLAMHL
jgi:protein KTI12